jgi:N4-gp56 family major capsid protein
MSKTTVETSNALRVQAWEKELFEDTMKESYFMPRFSGEGRGNIMQVKSNLEGGPGDKCTFGLISRLAGAGVTSRQTLEGNEENLQDYSFNLELEEYAHAVRDAGPLDRKRPIYDMDNEARDALQVWMSEKIDSLAFTALENSPTKILYGGDATSTADIEAADLITPGLLSKTKAWAMTGGNRSQTPIRPVSIGGKKYYVFLTHPDSTYDLKTDSTYAQARREAEVRGSENGIFSGALGVWDGVIVHEHENVGIVTNWGAGANIAGVKSSFMGEQALAWAWGARPKVNAQEFDYGREHGFAISMMSACEKPVFNSLDYGSIGIYTSRTQIGDA